MRVMMYSIHRWGRVGKRRSLKHGKALYYALNITTRELGHEESMSAVEAATPLEKHGGSQSELARKCLYFMSLMREVEDRVERKLYRQGKIAGAVYTGRGQEAIPVEPL